MGSWPSRHSPKALSGSPEAFVNELRKANCVVIFAKSECPYSLDAKQVFDKMRVPYEAINLDERGDGDLIQSYLGQLTGKSTVPRVFVNGECIGGGDDTVKLHRTGQLSKLVSTCQNLTCKDAVTKEPCAPKK